MVFREVRVIRGIYTTGGTNERNASLFFFVFWSNLKIEVLDLETKDQTLLTMIIETYISG